MTDLITRRVIDTNNARAFSAYRRLASINHPDKGGSAAAMALINAARDQGLAACEATRPLKA